MSTSVLKALPGKLDIKDAHLDVHLMESTNAIYQQTYELGPQSKSLLSVKFLLS